MASFSPYNWFEEEKKKREAAKSASKTIKNTESQTSRRGLEKTPPSQIGYGYSGMQTPGRGDSSFYTKQPDYGIIPTEQTKPKYLHEFRNEIAGYDDELAKLHKQQYHTMVYEQDGKKLDRLAQRQAQLEKEKAVLKDRYYSAMGIGSEGKSGSENMLIGEGNNPNFSYDDLYSVYGIDKDNMLPNKGLNFDKGNKTITFNGKTYEVAPDGKLREVPNTKPRGTMEDIRLYPKGQSPFDVGYFDENDLVMRYPKGQSPFDEGYFDDKVIKPQPYIIDPNEKPKDKSPYLMADTSSELINGVKGSAFLGASVTDDKTEEYPPEPSPSPMPGPPPVPKGHPEAYEKELEDRQKEQEELTGGFAGGGGGRSGAGGSWGDEEKELTYINKTTDNDQNVLQIDFTKEEFKDHLKKYGGNIFEYAKDLVPELIKNNPEFKGWSEKEIVADIVMHYDLYEMGIGGKQVSTCDIGEKKDHTKFWASLYEILRNRHNWS